MVLFCRTAQIPAAADVFSALVMKVRFFMPLAVGAALVSGPSCTGWPRGWTQAKKLAEQDSPAGAWTGTWQSIPTGHSGNLRCAVFPKGHGTWQYRYRATWAKVLCAGFTVDCEATRLPDGRWEITGQRDLGPLFGGTFTHKAILSDGQLQATYQATADHGTLTLRRLEQMP